LNISIPLELISKSDYITVHYLVNRDWNFTDDKYLCW